MTAEVRARVVESRRRQGKPDVIEDAAFLAALAAALLEQPTEHTSAV